MATFTTINPIFNPVMAFINEVIKEEDTRQILETDLRGMESFLLDIAFFFTYEEKEPLEFVEFVKIWLQLLQNSLTQAKGLLDRREGSCQRCLDFVMCNPRTLSDEIREWKALFNHLSQGFRTDFFQHAVLSGDVINSRVVAPVTELLKDVMKKEEDNPQIPQTEPSMKTLLQHMETLLQETTTLFRDEADIATLFRGQKNELLHIMRTCFQSLQSSLTVAKGLFDLEPRSTLSQEIREWSASFDKIYHGFQEDLLQRIVLSGNAINSDMVAPVMELLKDVISKEDNRHILQIDLRQMESLLQDITTFFRDEPDIANLFQLQRKELLEIVKPLFQLLQSCLTKAKGLFDLEPRSTLSQEIGDWKASFDHLYQGFQNDLFQRIVLSGNAINSRMVAPVMELLKDLINKEDNRHILQTDLRHMESLLQDMTTLFRDEPDITIILQGQKHEFLHIMRTWFQLLQRCLTDAKSLFDLEPRTLSQEIRDWKTFFDHVYEGFQNDLLQRIALTGNAINSRMVWPVMELLKDVIKEAKRHILLIDLRRMEIPKSNEDNRRILHILQIDLRRMESLLQYITTLFHDEPDIAIIFQGQKIELLQIMGNCFRLLQSFLREVKDLFDRDPRTLPQEIRDRKASFNHVYEGFQNDLLQRIIGVSGNAINNGTVGPVMELLKDVINKEDNHHILQTDLRQMESLVQDITTLFRDEPDIATLFQRPRKEVLEIVKTSFQLLQTSLTVAKGLFDLDPGRHSEEIREWSASFDKMYHGLQSDLSRWVTSVQFVSSKPFYAYKEEDASLGSGIIADEAQPLSKDEAWMLFRRVAFKGVHVSMDIQERARNIAEECRGVPLAINVVAAAMIGQSSVHEWDNCLSSIQTLDPSCPPTHHADRLDAQLYAQLRYSYDALPNSHVKRCFLYCAMYRKGEEIDTDTFLQMWIGEGLVKSQQGSYLMGNAIARKYLKLLVDRFFFHRVRKSRDLFGQRRTIRVHECIHDMAVYIGQKEENCVFSQNQLNFPEVHDENCSRISVAESSMVHLPTELRCPKLASLSLQGNRQLKELQSEFLLSLTSLRVLNLSGCSQITSIPTSIGQLRMLQFLSLSDLPLIKDLPEQICHVSSLQFLDLSGCTGLTSLPSQIGQLTNLKHLNLDRCESLEMIPREMSELTSLSRLQLSYWTRLSVEMEAPASIWNLKGLTSLTELQVWIDTVQQDGKRSRIKDGIMGTWSEMRHLALKYNSSYEEDLLPDDMQNMKKLQSFTLYQYYGLSLPNCMFEHLEMVTLDRCHPIRELTPLERLPNLKLLKLDGCRNLIELGIGSPNTYVSLQKLVLIELPNLESLGGTSSKTGVWNETTLPQLRVLKMVSCESLKRFPKGMEKLPNLCALIYQPWYVWEKSAKEWWERLRWEDQNMKIKLERIFIPRRSAKAYKVRHSGNAPGWLR